MTIFPGMEKIRREEIKIIAQYSNWSKPSVSKTLENCVYNDSIAWLKFLKVFFLGLGVSFSVAGIIFFFAYNWDELHKFVKLGLIAGLFMATSLTPLLTNLNPLLKKVLLTVSSLLVGVFLAVFGQVYQTGANAYDLFLNWTLFITLWVVIVNFAPLWTIFIALLNITVFLYAEQVAHDWTDVFVYTFLFLVNAFALSIFILSSKFVSRLRQPNWFVHLLALSAIVYGTLGACVGIFDPPENPFYILLLTGTLLYVTGVWHGLKTKSSFYIAIIGFSLIVIFSAFLIKLSDGAGMFLIVSLFIMASVTSLILLLINLHKKWNRQIV